MPDIICCYKYVVDEAYVKTSSSGKIDIELAEYKLSDYDRNAIEEAVELVEKHGGSVTAVTVGTPDDTKGIKDALSRGPEKAIFINDDEFDSLEPAQTSLILAEVIKKQKYDLIICGEGSSDIYAQQVGPRLAEKLGIPCLAYVQKVQIEGDRIIAERKTDDGIEVVTVSMPALLTVVPNINNPRIPGLKATLAASKKPVEEIEADQLSVIYERKLEAVSLQAARMERDCIRFSGQEKDIKAFVDELRKNGVLDRG